MHHQEWQELIPYYIAQTLPLQQKQAFELHLSNCASCQQDIEDWRMIASAVWREADAAAHQLPPLSQEVYNRLNYRDRAPGSRYSANPPQQSRRRAIRERSRQSSVPVTLVAGITVALIFGALLIGLAMRSVPQNPQQLAFGGGGGGGGIGGAAAVAVDSSPTALPLRPNPTQENLGMGGGSQIEAIQATPRPFVTNTFVPTPNVLPTQNPPTVPPPESAVNTSAETSLMSVASPTHTEEPSLSFAPESLGPYITLTPGIMESGAPLCEMFNPTTAAINVYSEASVNSLVTGALMPGETVRTIVISQEGWYFVVLPSLQRGWIAPASAYLRGNCAKSVLWLATPTMAKTAVPSTAAPTATFTGAIPALEPKVAVITSAYADLYARPFELNSIFGAVPRGNQYPIMAYVGTEGDRWVQLYIGDGNIPWVRDSQIEEYSPDEVPPQRTPIVPTPTSTGQ